MFTKKVVVTATTLVGGWDNLRARVTQLVINVVSTMLESVEENFFWVLTTIPTFQLE